MALSPLTRRRLAQFRANKRGYWSFWLFMALLGVCLFAEFLANDKPILVSYQGAIYAPTFVTYPETTFGGDFETETEYRDPYVQELIEKDGWIIWPPIRFSYDPINYNLRTPAPSPPDEVNWLGTDDQGRDVAARVIYGFP
ncbi:MAG TPA: ABC transporter permease, partial [Alphaproteobacteria bacterium]|nr:ABC transporter permease [Alphaproteobacteria bacterium]